MAKYTSVYTGAQVDAAVRESLTTGYGLCSTASDVAAKTVSIDNFVLSAGAKVFVKFTYANTATTPTLNVSNTGAFNIKKYGTTNMSSSWEDGGVVGLIYDGTNWIILADTSELTVSNGILQLA